MASFLKHIIFPIYIAFLLSTIVIANNTFSEHFANLKPTTSQKMTRLHFYFHDIVSGKNPTAKIIIGPKNSFGMTAIIDDPLTIDTKPGSTVVGRAKGLYALASQHDDPALLMAMNFVFTYGKYNKSTLSIMGLNHVFDAVREMPIIGGTGLFRFARGYALASTVKFNPKTGDAVVQYNVTVMHD